MAHIKVRWIWSGKAMSSWCGILDRLSRSLKDMLHILEKLTEAGAGFRSLTENVDSTVTAGKLLLSMLGAFAEFERSMVRSTRRFQQLQGGNHRMSRSLPDWQRGYTFAEFSARKIVNECSAVANAPSSVREMEHPKSRPVFVHVIRSSIVISLVGIL